MMVVIGKVELTIIVYCRMSLLNVECPKMLLFLPHNAWFDCNYNTIMQLQLNYVLHFLVAYATFP